MSSDFDIKRARAETRGCEGVIHFSNAGAALMPKQVVDTVCDYLHAEEMQGGYEVYDAHNQQLEGFYRSAAQLVNGQPEEIAFMESASRGWQAAFYALPLQKGDRILTAISEYGSNVVAYQHRVQQTGCELVFVPNNEFGEIDTTALAELIDDRVKLISLNYIPTGGGLVNPAAEVGRIAKAAGVPYLLDACQAVGHLALDVEKLGCDVLTGTGRKYLRGPRGTGFMWVREGFLDQLQPIVLDQFSAPLTTPDTYQLRNDARRFEAWERSGAGMVGLAAAIDYALGWGVDVTQERIYRLATLMRTELRSIEGVQITDEGAEQCGIVTFIAEALTPDEIKSRLSVKGINVLVSAGSGNLVSFQERGLEAVVRASLHYYNTEDEIAQFIQALKAILKS